MTTREVCKVLYSPHKVFKEIAQNPKYVGPVLIMALFIFASFGLTYVTLCKTYIDQTVPQDIDKWTEETSYWNSTTATIKTNPSDFIHGSFYYGNKSIEFGATSTNYIQIKLNSTENIRCSGADGYRNLTFRVKIIEPKDTLPRNISLYLDSNGGSFYRNITNNIIGVGLWNNVTLSFEDEWVSLGSPNWSQVTGLKFEFMWREVQENITLRVDGLFFHGLYKSRIEISGYLLFDLFNPYSPANAFMQFLIQWFFLGGLFYVFSRVFGVKIALKPLLVASGLVLIIYFIRILIFTIIYAVSPNLYFSLAYLSGVSGEWEKAYTQFFQTFSFYYTVLWVFDKLIWAWTIILCAVLARYMFELSWGLSIFTSVSIFPIYLILLLLFTPAPPILL